MAIVIKDKDGEVVERYGCGWSTQMPGRVECWGLELGDRVEADGYCLLRVTDQVTMRRRPPSGLRDQHRRRRKQLRGTRRHGRPRGR